MRLLPFLIVVSAFAGETETIRVRTTEIGSIARAGFTLARDVEVTLEATGLLIHDAGRFQLYYGWIIDAATRKRVWHAASKLREMRRGGLFTDSRTVPLPAGSYEVYYVAMAGEQGRRLRRLPPPNPDGLLARVAHRLGLAVSADADVIQPVTADALSARFARGSLFRFDQTGDDATREGFFRVEETARVRIYALGEGMRRAEMVDYAWLANASTGERIWFMQPREAREGGGHPKNLAIDETLRLAPGLYQLVYVTDDSHAFGTWNMPPPDDPYFWGVTLWPASVGDRRRIHVARERDVPSPLVALTGLGNDQVAVRAFRVSEPVTVSLVGLGELGYGAMADYGWLSDEHGKVIWSMLSAENTHAGGAYKNRMSRVVLRLPPGRYQLHYRTDDSHAPGRWNQDPPHAPEAYGISLFPAGERDAERIIILEETAPARTTLLAEIVRVGDGDYREQSFVVRRALEVTVEAIGEGTREDGMMDYAWIEDERSGRIIWEMRYERTEHAGGAARNRLVHTDLALPSGRYKVFFETDARHAYGAWVEPAPDHPERYGVRIHSRSP